MNSEALISLARKGDRNALKELLRPYHGLIRGLAKRFLWRKEDLDDAVQEIYVKCIGGIGSYRGACKLTTWIYRIGVNVCMDFNRAETSREKAVRYGSWEFFPDPNAPDGLRYASDSECGATIAKGLETLTDAERTAFESFYMREMSGAEAARFLSITRPLFFMRLKAARDKLFAFLTERGWII